MYCQQRYMNISQNMSQTRLAEFSSAWWTMCTLLVLSLQPRTYEYGNHSAVHHSWKGSILIRHRHSWVLRTGTWKRAIEHRHLTLPAFDPKLTSELNNVHQHEYGHPKYPDFSCSDNHIGETLAWTALTRICQPWMRNKSTWCL